MDYSKSEEDRVIIIVARAAIDISIFSRTTLDDNIIEGGCGGQSTFTSSEQAAVERSGPRLFPVLVTMTTKTTTTTTTTTAMTDGMVQLISARSNLIIFDRDR